MRTLFFIAAALLAGAAPATAKTVSISFDGFCDGMDITIDKDQQTAVEAANGCSKGAGYGGGTIGRIKNSFFLEGKRLTLGVRKDGSQDQFVYVLSYPLVTGGNWISFYTSDGKTLIQNDTGLYTVTDKSHSPRKGLRSTSEIHR
ncbi:MAG: hypothetical protein JO056_00970 [Alphaproteobacteria bacterium]|nr:hypothetical protein [Alphaproteobacteria bacterium]